MSAFKAGAIKGVLKLEMGDFNKSISGAKLQLNGLQGRFASLGKSAAVAGVAIAAAGVAVYVAQKKIRAAVATSIELESAFAGVRKTVDATEVQFGKLEQTLIDLSKRLPTTAKGLFEIAEISGQLGVDVDDLATFTEQIAILGETSNIAGEQAALALAQWTNVTGLPLTEIDRLVATIVGLGNEAATTERAIVELGKRITGTLSRLGASDAQLVGLAASMASVGLNAEMAGTAFNVFAGGIAKAVGQGSKELSLFAALTRKTEQEFKMAFEKDAVTTILDVVEALRKFGDEGGEVYGVMENLGVEGDRQRETLFALGGAMDKVRDYMAKATVEWDKGTAATDEMAKRMLTTAAQVQLAKNELTAFAKNIGDYFLPVTGDIAKKMTELIGQLDVLITRLPDAGKAWGAFFKSIKDGLTDVATDVRQWRGMLLEGFVSQQKECAEEFYRPMKEFEDRAKKHFERMKHAQKCQLTATQQQIRAMLLLETVSKRGIDLAIRPGSYPILGGDPEKQVDGIRDAGKEVSDYVKAVNAALEALLGRGAADKAGKTLDLLREKALALRESVLPGVGLGAAVSDVVDLAGQFPKIVDADVIAEQFGAIFTRFREQGIGAVDAVAQHLSGIPEGFRDLFADVAGDIERMLADSALTELKRSLDPGEDMFQTAIAGIEALKAAGEFEDIGTNLLGKQLYQQFEGANTQALEDATQRLRDYGEEAALVGASFSESMAQAQANLQQDQLGGLFDSLDPTREIIRDLTNDVQLLKDTGNLAQNTNLLSAAYWEQIRGMAPKAINEIIAKAQKLSPELAKAFQGLIKNAKKVEETTKFEKTLNNIDGLIGAIGQLGPKFMIAAKLASIASKIMRVAAALSGNAWAAVTLAVEAVAEALSLMGNSAKEELKGIDAMMEELGDAVDQWADQMAEAIVSFVRTGKGEFRDLANTILDELLKIGIANLITNPIADFIGDLFAKGAAFQNGVVVPMAKGATHFNGQVVAMAKGRVTTGPELFPMKDGRTGLMGEAGPEAVMPLERLASGKLGVNTTGSGPGAVVNIYDQSGGSVEYRESTGPDGEQILDIVILNKMKQFFAEGELDGDMALHFGLGRAV